MVTWTGSQYYRYIHGSAAFMRFRSVYVFLALGLIIFLVLFQQLLPSNDSPVTPVSLQSNLSISWNPEKDGKRLVMDTRHCENNFPGLYQELDRMIKKRLHDKITSKMLDAIERRNGYIRVMLYNQQLYVIDTEGGIYSRGFAVLQALHRAVVSSPELLPNIEFVISTDDKLPPTPLWSFAREKSDKITWLMPDFGFWSWPETKVGSYGEVQRKATAMEDTTENPTGRSWTWDSKTPKLFWRGATMGLKLREKFLSATAEKNWADVKAIDWKEKATIKSMDEHCQYKYLAHTEGNSYSGRLKYLQSCRSVIIAHKMDWIQHHTPLMIASGSLQNYIEVKRDFSDLQVVMLWLQKNDDRAAIIADNSVKMFREHYLTPAAEVCYWRQLIRGWASVSFKPEPWELKNGARRWRGLDVESWLLERRLDWDPY